MKQIGDQRQIRPHLEMATLAQRWTRSDSFMWTFSNTQLQKVETCCIINWLWQKYHKAFLKVTYNWFDIVYWYYDWTRAIKGKKSLTIILCNRVRSCPEVDLNTVYKLYLLLGPSQRSRFVYCRVPGKQGLQQKPSPQRTDKQHCPQGEVHVGMQKFLSIGRIGIFVVKFSWEHTKTPKV